MNIQKIEKIKNISKRYDIQTSTQNYYANNILVHNSLIKIWYHNNEWHLSTNGTINAHDADIQLPFNNSHGERIDSFGKLITYTLEQMFGSMVKVAEMFSKLDKDYTFIGELCTPYNRVVVPHKDCKLYYLSSRNNKTGQEKQFENLREIFPVPETYPLTTLEECIESAKKLPFNEEGYVVVDSKYRRIKCKGFSYLKIHGLRGEGVVSHKKVLDLIRMNEHTEFLSYFSEYQEIFEEIEIKYNLLISQLARNIITYLDTYENKDRKTLALWAIKECPIPAFIFSYADKKVETISEFILNNKIDSLLATVEKMEE